MAEISTNVEELPAATPASIIPKEIAESLPDSVLAELAHLPEAKQAEFVEAFRNQSKSLAFAYLTSLIYCHYGLLGRWAMTGLMWLSLFVASAVGSIWWLIDLEKWTPDLGPGA
jgi:hypothetical protein